MLRVQPFYTEDEMYSEMIELTRERYDKYQHRITDEFPKLKELTEDTILGAFSWFGIKSKTRIIKRANAVLVGGYFVTPADIARDYLGLKFPKGSRRRITAEQKEEIMKRRSHPLYARPMRINHAAYIDLKSAYLSIMSVVGWDVDYYPNRWLRAGESMIDFPFSGVKLARNILVTSGLMGNTKVWIHGDQRLTTRPVGNRFTNYQLWALCMDVLNGIAYELLEESIAVYVHTDGYIVDIDDLVPALKIINSWGLPARIKKEGRCSIYNAGRYKFGEFEDVFPAGSTGHNAIANNPYRHWLKSRFSKLSLLAQPALPFEIGEIAE